MTTKRNTRADSSVDDLLKAVAETHDAANEWKNVNWDAIQRRRFANADAEIPPEDSMTEKLRDRKDDE